MFTIDDLNISFSNDQGSSIDQNNDNISLSSIDEDNSIIYEDIDEDISEDTEIKNEDEEMQNNKTYHLNEALPLEHYEENDYNVNENDEHSSTYQSLDEEYDQQDELLEKYSTIENKVWCNGSSFIDKNEGVYRISNASKGVETLNMTFKGKHYPSITRKQLLILKK